MRGRPAQTRSGLAQAIALANSPAAVQAARAAFTSGLDIAMGVGSACVLATAVVVAWKMPRPGPGQVSSPDRSVAASAAQGDRHT